MAYYINLRVVGNVQVRIDDPTLSEEEAVMAACSMGLTGEIEPLGMAFPVHVAEVEDTDHWEGDYVT